MTGRHERYVPGTAHTTSHTRPTERYHRTRACHRTRKTFPWLPGKSSGALDDQRRVSCPAARSVGTHGPDGAFTLLGCLETSRTWVESPGIPHCLSMVGLGRRVGRRRTGCRVTTSGGAEVEHSVGKDLLGFEVQAHLTHRRFERAATDTYCIGNAAWW